MYYVKNTLNFYSLLCCFQSLFYFGVKMQKTSQRRNTEFCDFRNTDKKYILAFLNVENEFFPHLQQHPQHIWHSFHLLILSIFMIRLDMGMMERSLIILLFKTKPLVYILKACRNSVLCNQTCVHQFENSIKSPSLKLDIFLNSNYLSVYLSIYCYFPKNSSEVYFEISFSSL